MILLKPSGQVIRELAERCEVERRRLGFSQKELANRAGLSVFTYLRFVHHGQISLGRFVAVMAVLQRLEEVDQLLQRQPPPNPYQTRPMPQRIRRAKPPLAV
jgi:hypothetical protein